MQGFNYQAPSSVADAAKAAAGSDAKIVAGGQSLIAAMKLGLAAPSALVDLHGIAALKGITVASNTVTIGAMTTHAEVAASKEVAKAIPALAALAAGIGDRQVRNRGTLGGSARQQRPGSVTTRRPCSGSARRSRPTAARSRPTPSSRACTKRHCRTAR